jgi:hypothetical protein
VARTTERSARTRRIVGLTTTAVIIALGIAFVATAPGRSALRGDARTSADLRPAARTPTPTSTPTRTPPPVDNSAEQPRTGPGIDAVGIYLQFGARADGNLDVTERVVLAHPSKQIAVRPPSATAAGQAFSDSRPAIRALQVQAGGLPVANVPTRLDHDRQFRLKQTTAAFTLRYQLSGTTVRSVPSTANRALAYIRPISVGIDAATPVQMLTTGTSTLNLTCPQLPAELQGCARGTAPHLRVETGVTVADDTVIVQLNLPEP